MSDIHTCINNNTKGDRWFFQFWPSRRRRRRLRRRWGHHSHQRWQQRWFRRALFHVPASAVWWGGRRRVNSSSSVEVGLICQFCRRGLRDWAALGDVNGCVCQQRVAFKDYTFSVPLSHKARGAHWLSFYVLGSAWIINSAFHIWWPRFMFGLLTFEMWWFDHEVVLKGSLLYCPWRLWLLCFVWCLSALYLDEFRWNNNCQ